MENNTIEKKKRQEVYREEEERRVSLPGGEILINARAELLELAISSGLQVIEAMFQEDVEALCGPRYHHHLDSNGFRWGRTNGEVTLGGRRIQINRPRVRSEDRGELSLPTYEHLKDEDPLRKRVFEQLLIGVSTRRYRGSLETEVNGISSRAISKSAVSRRLVTMTQQKLFEWLNRSLKGLALTVIFIDGTEFGKHTVIVAIGVDSEGHKHVLGAWEGSTENTYVAQSLMSDLVERGLKVDEASVLVVIDGSKALHKAVRQTFGEVRIQRCQRHKIENVKGHLPRELHTSVEITMRQAYQSDNVDTAKRILTNLASRLETDYPGAASSLREGLEETLTVIDLGLPKTLRQSLQTTNMIESTLSVVEDVCRNVKCWKNGKMVLRWTVTGLIETEKRFKRIRGYKDLPLLIQALGREKRGFQNIGEVA